VRAILAARRFDKLQTLANELGDAIPLEMNVADKNSVLQAFKQLEKMGEKIHICINNAGIAKKTSVFALDEQNDFESIIQTNVMGVWYVTKVIVKHMKEHSIHGSIINIGSINGDAVPWNIGSAYSISKAAVRHLTKTLVGELSPHKIRINCISPGWCRTPMSRSSVDKVPSGDIAEPSDLDGLILYLASNDASHYVTGSCFTIDNGASWGGRPL